MDVSLTSIVSLAAGIIGSAVGFAGYQVRRADRRYVIYDELRRIFDESPEYSRIFNALDLIDDKDEKKRNKGRDQLSEIKPEVRHGFLAFLERIALIWRSGLVNIRVLNYNFGYWIVLAFDTDEMWPNGEDRSHPYYASLSNFVDQLRREKEKLEGNPGRYAKYVKVGGFRDLLWNPFS
ncbi:hypothetical protein FHT87_005903 [Rhizobium sp. BK316]|uniref:hypothetical protein n=1 Tax=Rhizobium sp. BK316 TaxID=2587053 RepID=UPI0016224ED0|nr:hypothetical protein [Rhizobium sp. BK316]MBB3411936.1 hypothetical protein [Rhizobium sp. BK316]